MARQVHTYNKCLNMMSNNRCTWNIPYAGGEMPLNRKDHREECDGMIT